MTALFVDVTCAVLLEQNRVLAAQRSETMSHSGLWEFPGGKIEAGETAEACLRREIREELGLEIQIIQALKVVEHHYPDKAIRLWPFVCSPVSGALVLAQHAQIRWCSPSELRALEWLAADLPVLEQALPFLAAR